MVQRSSVQAIFANQNTDDTGDFATALDRAIKSAGDNPSEILRQSYLFEIEQTFIPNGLLVDIGGGVSVKNTALANLGMRVIVFDLFESYYDCAPSGSYDITNRKRACLDAGVELIDADIFEVDLVDRIGTESVDIVASLHVFEHLHRSPRPIVEQAMNILKRNGKLHIEVPNAANLRKRIDLLFGRTNYPDFMSFYEKPVWHGHVREYTTSDLSTLAQQTGHPFTIYGRNYYGNAISRVPAMMRIPLDRLLRAVPGLCGSLFLDIRKH